MYMDELINTDNEDRQEHNENNFEYGKTYYIDKAGIPISERELSNIMCEDTVVIQSCCRLQVPRGFKIISHCPGMCFNLSNISCVKNPIVKKVDLPSCKGKHPTECEVVTGYEIKAVGEVEFSASVPICPIKGQCIKNHSNICCNTIVPVNKIISYTCCPKPCPKCEDCVDWKFTFICIHVKEDGCGQYLQINMGVALEYTGVCECDEE